MFDPQKEYEKVLIISEALKDDSPHFDFSSLEAFAIELSRYFDVFLLIPVYSAFVKEKYTTDIYTSNNYTRLVIYYRRSSFSFLSQIRAFGSYRAGMKIIDGVFAGAQKLILYGNEAFEQFKYLNIKEISRLIGIINRPLINRASFGKLKSAGAVFFSFFEPAGIADASPGLIKYIPMPVNVSDAGMSDASSEDYTLFVVNDLPMGSSFEKLKRLLSASEPGQIKVSCSSRMRAALQSGLEKEVFVTDGEEFKTLSERAKSYVLAGDYHDTCDLLARLIATEKQVVFLGLNIPSVFPFESYCRVFDFETMTESDFNMISEKETATPVDDALEFISDNFSPEVLAFAIKNELDG